MNLLTEGIENQVVVRTAMTRKLTIDGLTKAYPVYKVKLDCLFYNDQNDRIATWISKYKHENNGKAPDPADKEAYNGIIESFIVESNPDAIKKTKNNIELFDQREAGVVLADGRIIDGNRRFTCLRQLNRQNIKYGYFETVILDRTLGNSAKQIKMLELSIQHGEESKVDYNPIDRLVGIYTDLIETKLLSVSEYAASTNTRESEVKQNMELANLMIEFLEFINAPKQFYVARDLQAYYPLEELQKLLKKCSNEDEIEDLKISIFNNILMRPAGDMTRFIRSFKSIIGSEHQDEFLAEQMGFAETTVEKLASVETVNSETIRDVIRADKDHSGNLERSVEKHLVKVKKNETRNRPIQLLEKATNFVSDIDTNILAKLNDSELQRLERQLNILQTVIDELRENLI